MSDINHDINGFDGQCSNTFGGFADQRQFSLAESIVPYKPYNGVIDSDKYRFFFESVDMVDKYGSFCKKKLSYKLVNLDTNIDVTNIDPEITQKYINILKTHLNEE